MLAIIGGTGLSKLPNLKVSHRQMVRTPFGEPSCALTFGSILDQHVVFLARHGYGHTIPPHLINYRANIWALSELKVRQVIALASVGSIQDDLMPGDLVVPDQIIDYTWGRHHTFFEGGDRPVRHVDFTYPYAEHMRQKILTSAAAGGEQVRNGGVYGAMQGPRLESAAEILRLGRDGCTLVGMTGMPEAALARELGMDYAQLCIVANHAAGRGDSYAEVNMNASEHRFAEALVKVHRILELVVKNDKSPH